MNKLTSKFYLVGIKGTGMTSLASFLKDLGHIVVGSDTEEEFFTDNILSDKKIEVLLFNKNNITSEYTYIISNAYDEKNEEVQQIMLNDFEYYYYDKFIGNRLNKNIIAIAGTHGKTTTTSFLAQMLKKKCSYIIGDGNGYGTNASDYLILESCEYKNHFLSYHPYIALITNIDYDHPDYFHNIDEVINSFQSFAYQSQIVIINNDDLNSNKIQHKNKYTFGFSDTSDFIIKIKEINNKGYSIDLFDKYNNKHYELNVDFLGLHYVYDFVGAYVVTILLKEKISATKLKLANRRMTEYIYNNCILVDDYAHHPKEIECLFNAIKMKYPEYKYNVIFQPHTYTRTVALGNDFIKALDLYNEVYIEKTFTSKREQQTIKDETYVNKLFDKYHKFTKDVVKEIDGKRKEVWIFLGAGIVNKYILNILSKKEV